MRLALAIMPQTGTLLVQAAVKSIDFTQAKILASFPLSAQGDQNHLYGTAQQ